MFFNKEPRNYNRRYKEDYGFIRTFYITWFLYFVVYPAGFLFYNVKVFGRENIDKKQRYLYTSNHTSYIDPPLISIVANKPVAYMAKKELYTSKNLLTRFLVISLGSFAVDRDKPEIATFKTIKDIVNKTKWSLGIFPQGKITPDNSVEDVQKGFITVAKSAKMDIVPIVIKGFDGYAKRLFQKHIELYIQKPISYELPEEEILEKWKSCYACFKKQEEQKELAGSLR